MVAHIATRIVDSSRTNIQGVGDNTNYTLPSGTNVIVLCSSVQDQGDRFLTSLNYHLQYSTNGTNWFDVPTSGTDTVPRLLGSNTGTALTDNSGVTSGERRAAPTSNPSEDGFVSNGGREHTTSNQLNYGAKVDDSQCEAQFALDFQYASAATYRFRIVWGSRSGDSNIDQTSAVAVSAPSTTDYTREATDVATNTIVNTVSSSQGFVRNPEDLVSQHIQITEVVPVVAKNYTREPNLDQLATVSDSLVLDIVKAPDDESVAASDSVAVSISLVKTDGVTVDDSGARDHDQAYTRAPDDESVTVEDSASLAIAVVADDSLAVSDTPVIDEDNAYTRTPDGESVSVSDDATFALSIVHQDGVTALADNPAIDHDDDQPATAEDTFTVSDSASTVVTFAVTPEDTFVVSDSASSGLVLTRSKDESLAISDSVLVAVSFGADATATATVSDSVLTDHDDNVQKTPSESFTISDSVSTVVSYGVTPEDTFEVSDQTSKVALFDRANADSFTVSDSVDTVISFAITPSDVAEVSEDVIADSDNTNTRQPSDSVLIDDSVNLGLSLVTPDTGSVSDSANAVKGTPFVRVAEDSISAGDGTGIGIGIDVGDQFEIDDRGNLTHGRNPEEGVSIDDFPLKTRQPKCNAEVEDSNILDITFIKVSEVTAGDSATAHKQQDFEEQISDEAGVTDSATLIQPIRREITATIVGNGGIDPNLMKEAQAVATIDVWNVALNALGISTLETTTGNNPQQTLLNNTFPLFRKQFLSDHLWNGAKKTANLTALTVNSTDQAVANRWKYVFVLPTDCMRVWRLNGQENKPVHVGGNANIYTNRWEIEVVTKGTTGGDTNTGKYRALCTNEDEARIEYVFDVGNDIDLLGPLTQHAMGMALAAFVATNFGKSASEIAQLEAQAKDAITAAKGVDGQEGTPQMFGDTSLLGVRSIGY
jgi:hypothetical protein